MPKLAANLSWLWTELPFLERFEAAAAAGFRAVELLFPYAFAKSDLVARLETLGLGTVLFNLPPGDWDAGERGLAALPERRDEFRRGAREALDYARALGCRKVHCMAGVIPAALDRTTAEATYVENVRWLGQQAGAQGVDVLLEPLNTLDVPGYLLSTTTQALEYLERVSLPNVKLQLDLYHCQVMEGDLARKIDALAGRYAHVQLAGNPGRHEPDVGEINYPFLLDRLDAVAYDGWVGCEYRPLKGTLAGLGWARRYGIRGP